MPLNIFDKNSVALLTFGRIIFIATGVMVQKSLTPAWLFQSDWFRILNIWLFAATNGYNVGIVMLLGPKQVEARDKERAGMLMNFHLVGGVVVGAIFAALIMSRV